MLVHYDSCCVVDEGGLKRNLDSSLARGLPHCTKQDERKDELAIVAGGPSLRKYVDDIRSWPSEVWAINGAYDWLLSKGIVANGFLGVDPLPGLVEYVRNIRPETTCYLSGLLDPVVFDALTDRTVNLFFPEQDAVVWPAGLWLVSGGTTAVTRAPCLARLLGYRRMTIFGADSSFERGDDRYCYKYGTYKEDSKAPVNKEVYTLSGEGPFLSEICLMKQVAQIGVIVDRWPGITIKCDGLLDAYLRQPTL